MKSLEQPAKVALVMIVKGTADEAIHLERCLENVASHVDGIYLNLNHAKGKKIANEIFEVCARFRTIHIETEWREDFAAARNAILDTVPDDFSHILWLDTDDTVDKPQKVREVATKAANYDAVFADYLYEADDEGNPVTVHMVARLFKHNGAHRWKGRIHETLIETRAVTQVGTKDFVIIHHADGERRVASLERNIRMLELQLKDEEKNPDPRTIYYLGCTYIDIGNYDVAKDLLEDYLRLSGWDQERAVAHTKIGRMFLEEGNRAEAKKHFMLAIGEAPDDPEPRVEMGSLEIELKQYQKARSWLEGVEAMEKTPTTLERNPMSYTFRTYLLLADTYLGLGGSYLDKALEYGKKALKYKKKDKDVREYVKVIENVVRDKKLTEHAVALVDALKKNKEDTKIQTLADSLPKQLDDNPIVLRLRNEESYTWPEKSVVIMSGDSAIDAWGPWSLEEGIGGSEEAVIRLSKHLRDLGYKVVVYGKPFDRAGLHDGVMWRNFWEWNPKDKFDIFVAWRAPFIFDQEIKARKNYLWLHDVVEPGEFTETRLNNLDKVIVLSEYHRCLFPMIPDDKILMSANGIDPAEFKAMDKQKIKRDAHKVFYGSSHVRGLAYLYEIWPDVLKEVPDATLDVYYGRESYDAINAGNPERIKWMDDMQLKAKELKGVTDHGKVSQNDIMRHAFESGVWAYPCPFPEIYAITAIKCQAAGAIPVSSNFAALNETVQFGHKQEFKEFNEADLEIYKQALIWWLKHPEEQQKIRPAMVKWARTNSWRKVAEGWDHEFQS